MSVKKELRIETSESSIDFENLYISVIDFPKPNSVYFNFKVDGNSNGFHILNEDWPEIIRFIQDEMEKNKVKIFNK